MMKTMNSAIEKSIKIEGGELSYEITGAGIAVLCLPSLGDTRREYEKFAPELVEQGYRVLTTDLRGMGKSRGKFKKHDIPTLASDIKAILDAEKIEKAFLVACSVSGASAGYFAVHYPERVAGLIMFNPIIHTGPRLMTMLVAGLIGTPGIGKGLWLSYFKSLYPTRKVDDNYLAHIKEQMALPGALKSIAGMTRAKRIDDIIGNINVPILIFFGSKDPDFKSPEAEAKLMQQEIKQAQVEVLNDSGHYPQREFPELVLPRTLEFLKAIR
ncbi:alpha/beta hydrolase [Candidatus Chlorohelix sp.]|uniref:alpha/beta fold hydrolase n=1 Tax=Candidatus Chlorohelix sp. TaxID=3139201 RepID=UPI00303F4277